MGFGPPRSPKRNDFRRVPARPRANGMHVLRTLSAGWHAHIFDPFQTFGENILLIGTETGASRRASYHSAACHGDGHAPREA